MRPDAQFSGRGDIGLLTAQDAGMAKDQAQMTIGALGEATSVGAETIRYTSASGSCRRPLGPPAATASTSRSTSAA